TTTSCTDINTLSLHDALPIFRIRQVHHHLESIGRLSLSLKIGERWRKVGFANLDFHQEPGLAITNHQEVKIGETNLSPSLAYFRSEEHTSELQSLAYLVCRLL